MSGREDRCPGCLSTRRPLVVYAGCDVCQVRTRGEIREALGAGYAAVSMTLEWSHRIDPWIAALSPGAYVTLVNEGLRGTTRTCFYARWLVAGFVAYGVSPDTGPLRSDDELSDLLRGLGVLNRHPDIRQRIVTVADFGNPAATRAAIEAEIEAEEAG